MWVQQTRHSLPIDFVGGHKVCVCDFVPECPRVLGAILCSTVPVLHASFKLATRAPRITITAAYQTKLEAKRVYIRNRIVNTTWPLCRIRLQLASGRSFRQVPPARKSCHRNVLLVSFRRCALLHSRCIHINICKPEFLKRLASWLNGRVQHIGNVLDESLVLKPT